MLLPRSSFHNVECLDATPSSFPSPGWYSPLLASNYDTRFLFGGSQYLPEANVYDMRNRVYHVTLNRFLQTDPIGFEGDALNLYRYCGNDPVNKTDPMGLDDIDISPAFERAGVEASLRSYNEGIKDTRDPYLGRGAVVAPNGRKYTIGQTVKGQVQKNAFSRGVRLIENYGRIPAGGGIGHVHYDQNGRPGKNSSDFSGDDYGTATTKVIKGKIDLGTTVWKVNESTPNRVERLTPQTEPGLPAKKPVNSRIVREKEAKGVGSAY